MIFAEFLLVIGMKRILLLVCLLNGVIHLANADEGSSLPGRLGSTTLGGYVDSGISWLGQSDPGPATGGGIDRMYDDGFVRVDAAGNPGGYTWFWGYQDAAQIQDSFISFHSQAILDENIIQLVTDTYQLSNWFLPSAPYAGSFEGPGPVLPDAPFSRVITIVPEPSFTALAVVSVVVAIILRSRAEFSKQTIAGGARGRHGRDQTQDS